MTNVGASMILILTTLFFSWSQDIGGTYNYCCFDCYWLTLNEDSSFVLIDESGEWNIKRTSKGLFRITGDTLTIEEKTRKFESNATIDTSGDKLTTYKFVILSNGQLQSESFI